MAERVAFARIESCGDKNEFGTEYLRRRQQLLLETREDFLTTGIGWQRTIQGRAFPGSRAGLVGPTGPRIPGMLVRAEEEHAGVLVKDVLRAIAVMHVPIDDQHAFETV